MFLLAECSLPWSRRLQINRCGQSQLAAAALHLLDGVPVHSLALHSLHGDASRTAEATLVSRFVEARRNVPSVLYLPDAHQWWDGEDSAVHPHLRYKHTLLFCAVVGLPACRPPCRALVVAIVNISVEVASSRDEELLVFVVSCFVSNTMQVL